MGKKYKINLEDIIFVAVMLIIAASVTVFARSFQTWEYPFVIILPILASIRLNYKYNVQLDNRFKIFIVFYLIYYILLTIKWDEIHYKFLLIYPISFFITFSFIRSLKLNFFKIYEKLLIYLSCVGLIFWLIQIFSPEQLTNALKNLSLEPYAENIKANIIFYTIVQEGIETVLPRNSGFAWEPGAFSVFINLAIYINLISNKFKLKNNFGLYILILTLLTTQSTTGYSIFLFLVLFYLINSKSKSYLGFAIPVFIIVSLYISSLPFMFDKIEQLYSESIFDVEEIANKEWNTDKTLGAQRFVSFQMDYKDFLNNPILGYGGHDEDMWTRKENLNVVSISGIGKILARFGIIGFIFFILVLYKSSLEMSKIFNYKGKLILFLLIIQISISYSLIENPLLMCFWMFYFFKPKIKLINYNYFILHKLELQKYYNKLLL